MRKRPTGLTLEDLVPKDADSSGSWGSPRKNSTSRYLENNQEPNTRKVTLNAQQNSSNILFEFLVQLSLKDESVQGKCIYENDKLQDFLQLMKI